jgi:hypothetical protein
VQQVKGISNGSCNGLLSNQVHHTRWYTSNYSIPTMFDESYLMLNIFSWNYDILNVINFNDTVHYNHKVTSASINLVKPKSLMSQRQTGSLEKLREEDFYNLNNTKNCLNGIYSIYF